MNRYSFILGSHPELSIEELLTVLGPLGSIKEVSRSFVIFDGDIDPKAMLQRIGGTIKIAHVVESADTWQEFTEDRWLHILRSELRDAKGRFAYGVSIYSDKKALRDFLHRCGLSLKKRLRSLQLSARFVFNPTGILSSVVVQKNKLLGRELIICDGSQYYFCVTLAVQDFESYGLRDYGRPARNQVRGMLPPKVAQIMLNLGRCTSDDRLLDPFCGGGTILQEALLMGLQQVFGSDKDPSAIQEAEENFNWLSQTFNTVKPTLIAHDIATIDRQYPRDFFSLVVSEPYLGPARLLTSKSLMRSDLQKIIAQLDVLYNQIFESLSPIVHNGGKLVILFPIFRLFGTEYYVGNLKRIEAFGFRRVAPAVTAELHNPKVSDRGNLMYAREDQVVSREITVWKKQTI